MSIGMKVVSALALAGWSLSAAAEGPGTVDLSYRAGWEVRVHQGPTASGRATIEAVESGSGRVVWSMSLRDEETKGGREAPIASIRPYGEGLVVVTEKTGPDPGGTVGSALTYLVDTARRKSERVVDARGDRKECEVHHKPLLDDVVKIRFGKPRIPSSLVDEPGYPHANTVHLGGCAVGEAERALVRYCPVCREIKAKKYPTPEDDAG